MLVDYINEAKNKIEYGENNLGWRKGLSVSVNDEVGDKFKNNRIVYNGVV